jgi:hypothetical protein
VKAVLAAAKLTVGSSEILRLNGADTTKEAAVKNGDTVLILKPIKGAR